MLLGVALTSVTVWTQGAFSHAEPGFDQGCYCHNNNIAVFINGTGDGEGGLFMGPVQTGSSFQLKASTSSQYATGVVPNYQLWMSNQTDNAKFKFNPATVTDNSAQDLNKTAGNITAIYSITAPSAAGIYTLTLYGQGQLLQPIALQVKAASTTTTTYNNDNHHHASNHHYHNDNNAATHYHYHHDNDYNNDNHHYASNHHDHNDNNAATHYHYHHDNDYNNDNHHYASNHHDQHNSNHASNHHDNNHFDESHSDNHAHIYCHDIDHRRWGDSRVPVPAVCCLRVCIPGGCIISPGQAPLAIGRTRSTTFDVSYRKGQPRSLIGRIFASSHASPPQIGKG